MVPALGHSCLEDMGFRVAICHRNGGYPLTTMSNGGPGAALRGPPGRAGLGDAVARQD